ncbi:MAG: hypothetical protein HYW51_01500 [Candidatus Doudnabacteria bacterium]|nr:hypothetical protein [Candidatus Doudnabacteria bacterium]
MKSKIRLGLLLFVVVFALNASANNTPLSAEKILDLVNADRAERGLNPVKLSPSLNLAASAKAYDMLEYNYFSHTSPSGTKPWHWFKSLGYNYTYAGENLAQGFSNPVELEQSWMASETHRDNILSSDYAEMGIAIVQTQATTLIVQFFGSKEDKLTVK